MSTLLKTFRPNLIPNNPKDNSFDLDKVIMKNGGYGKYYINKKKDGVRLELLDGLVLSRALKVPGSRLVIERFQTIAIELERLNIAVDGEFYMHGAKFNSIFRFFTKEDVESLDYHIELTKAFRKDPIKFKKDYDGLSIDFLTNFHSELQIHIFDGIILDRQDLVGYEERMVEIRKRLKESGLIKNAYIEMTSPYMVVSRERLQDLYEEALEQGYEGLVLTHKDHEYKFGRNSLSQGTLLKMKDDALEYDAVVLNVMEGTSIKEGIETTVSKLGYSETSKKKDDRELSGLAKGFLVSFTKEDGTNLGEFIVGLNGFDNEAKRELLINKENYIGRYFTYTAMVPVKDFPRHAFFKNWRDEK